MSDEHIQAIVDRIPERRSSLHRFVIAIAGPPASGKSTLAADLVEALRPGAGLLGMDAFHFDNRVLDARGHLDRKGAPHTFDVDGYSALLARLRTEPTRTIAVPEFDRSLELARNSAQIVSGEHSILVTEGNYLLLDDEPWNSLAPLFDLTVWLDVPTATIEERITQRWLDHGLSASDAAARLQNNDLPNAKLAQANSRRADVVISA